MIALRNLLLIVWGLACKACAWLQCLSVPCQCHRDTAANGEHTHAEQHTRPSRLWPEGPDIQVQCKERRGWVGKEHRELAQCKCTPSDREAEFTMRNSRWRVGSDKHSYS